MYLSGIADEASAFLARQLAAHRELGWRHVELRSIEGKNLTDLSDEAFDHVVEALALEDIRVSSFASQLGNWARPISGDFALDLSELERAIPRMRRIGTTFIRCMSWPNAAPPRTQAEWRGESVRRMRELALRAEAGGVTLVHENCSGWGGQGPEETLRLLEEVDSRSLKLVFDTGNPAQYGQDAWEYYRQVREAIVYVHVKDYVQDGGEKERAVFAGDGTCSVRRIIDDLARSGYDGGFSIEPHITSVIHLLQEASDPALAYSTYVEYGRRFEALLRDIIASLGRGLDR
jgi:sugar phosphate isomerase/epimerase